MITGKKIAYVRVSTAEQNEARQLEALKPYEVDKIFLENASAKDTHRPKLQEITHLHMLAKESPFCP